MSNTRFVLIVEAQSECEDLETLERVAKFIGLKQSFSKGDAIPLSLRGIEKESLYNTTRFRVVDYGGGIKGVSRRLAAFPNSSAFRALKRLRAAYGQDIKLQTSLATFEFDGKAAMIAVPLTFIKACSVLEIQLSIMHYS